jgi:hypothetical protein
MSRLPYSVRPLDPWIGPRTRLRSDTPFSSTWSATLTLLDREIAMLGGRRYVLQIDVSERWIRQDGELYARAQPASPAVRVSFDSRHGPLMYACDRFTHWQANVRAIALALEALRKVDRYGVGGHGEQYRGWTALDSRPAEMTRAQAAEFIAHWAEPDQAEKRDAAAAAILAGNREALKAAYRAAARRTHPDLTGDVDTFKRLNVARDLLDEDGVAL